MYNSDKLKATQKLLEDLGNGMTALFNEYKEDFLGDELVTSQFKSFFEEHKRAMERIKNPVLSIATIGTTSSGKSTLTNALAGKMVAPIDSGEKSAGILVLRNSNKRSLYIEKTKNAKWKTGQIKQDISDEETYNINSDTMKTYFDNRKNSAPPRIYSKGPLLIGSSPEMLNLPEDICVELVDLPGLKNSGDKENLSVIQEMLTRSLCLVAMDYSHTDDENRKKLLGELKDIVNFLGGRQDSIIFLLNRVDLRNETDVELDLNISNLKKEIKEVLALKNEPEIIPFTALPLFYAQCAWGPASHKDKNKEPQYPNDALKYNYKWFLKSLMKDCYDIYDSNANNAELEKWLSDLRINVKHGEDLSEEDLRKLLDYTYQCSNGNLLFKRIQERLNNSFSQLIIMPAICELFKIFCALHSTLKTLGSIRVTKSKLRLVNYYLGTVRLKTELIGCDSEEAANSIKRDLNSILDELAGYESKDIPEEERKRIEKVKSEVLSLKEEIEISPGRIGEKKQEFQENLQEITRKINEGKGTYDAEKFVNEHEEIFGSIEDFSNMFDSVTYLTEELRLGIMEIIGNSIINNDTYDEVMEKIDFLPVEVSSRLARAYDYVSRIILGGLRDKEVVNNHFVIKSANKTEEIQKYMERYDFLDVAMNRALSARAGLLLQSYSNELVLPLRNMIQGHIGEIAEICRRKLGINDLEMTETIENILQAVDVNELSLPDGVFEFASKPPEENISIGKKTEWKTRVKQGSFCGSNTTETYLDFVDVMGNVYYFPNGVALKEKWDYGLTNAKELFWKYMFEWMAQQLNSYSDAFSVSINTLITTVNATIKSKITMSEQKHEEEVDRWNKILLQANNAAAVSNGIKDVAVDGNGV